MTTPRMLSGSSPEDDPTGVRALLSSLPDPGPMPTYLVDRISASLAAEQAQRTPADPLVVTPLAARRSRRSASRVLLAIAGAAAAVAVVGIVGSNLLSSPSSTTGAGAALSAATSEAATGGDYDSGKTAVADTGTPQLQIRRSSTDYREAGFAEQAKALTAPFPAAASPLLPPQPTADLREGLSDGQLGPLDTPAGLLDCLLGIGLTRADLVVADLATYNGGPAVVIVATRARTSTAYVVGRDCNRTTPSLLRAAVPLP